MRVKGVMIKLAAALTGFYLPFAVGFVFKRRGWLSDSAVKSLSKLVLYFFFPILLFDSVYRKNIADVGGEFTYMVFSSLYVIFTSLALALAIMREERDAILPVAYVNAAYLPLPIAYALWGLDALPLIGFYVLANTTLGNVMAPVILGGGSVRDGLKRLAKFPPLYALTLGIAAGLAGVKMPAEFADTFSNIGRVAPYLALVVLGAQVTNVKKAFLDNSVKKAMAIRFVASPLLVLASQHFYPPPTPLASKVAILESFMPPAVANVIYANEYSQNPEKVARIVFTLTLVATLTIPILISLLLS